MENLHTPDNQLARTELGALNFLALQENFSQPQTRGANPEQPVPSLDLSNNQFIRDGLIPNLQITGMGGTEMLAQAFPTDNNGAGQYGMAQQAVVAGVLGAVMNGLRGGDQSPADSSAQPDAPVPALPGLNSLYQQSLNGWGDGPTPDSETPAPDSPTTDDNQ
jgi:hypothetical protein